MANSEGSSGKTGTGKKWPAQTREQFIEWFWTGTNGNDLVKELNRSPSHGDNYIRREKDRPTVYGIVLNDAKLTPEKNWKMCKVGFTQVPTVTGADKPDNRMDKLKKEIDREYKDKTEGREAKASVLFVLPIGAVDTTPYFDTEKRIRAAVGLPIDKELAKKLHLPCSTEWVLTTQAFIDMIKAKIAELKDTDEPIDLFKYYKFNTPAPPWAGLDSKKTTVVDFSNQKTTGKNTST